jgi:hypothetical protein
LLYDTAIEIEHRATGRLKVQILYYGMNEGKNIDLLDKALKTIVSDAGADRYTTVENLRDRLLQKFDAKTIAVVQAATEKDLIDLYFIQHLLRKVMLILLLPDIERHTIAMGHRLHPSFMCGADADVPEIAKAIHSIVVNGIHPQPIGQFGNPFESLIPWRLTESQDHLVHAA